MNPFTLMVDLVKKTIDEVKHTTEEISEAVVHLDDQGWFHGARILPGITPTGMVYSQEYIQRVTGNRTMIGLASHYTCTRGVGARGLAKRIAGKGGGRAASWHLAIDRSGLIAQSASIHQGTWHAGSSTAKPVEFRVPGRANYLKVTANASLVGIELENVGMLKKVNGQWLGWPFHWKDPKNKPVVVPDDEVFKMAHGGWHMFTKEQKSSFLAIAYAFHMYLQTILTTSEISPYLNAINGSDDHIQTWLGFGHHDIDPTRREDPGPLWEQFLKSHGFRDEARPC